MDIISLLSTHSDLRQKKTGERIYTGEEEKMREQLAQRELRDVSTEPSMFVYV